MSEMGKNFAPTLSGSILLTACSCDWDLFRMQFFDDWNVEIDAEPVSDNLIFNLGEVTVTLSLMNELVPQAWETAENNYLWPEAADVIQTHQAHIVLGVIGADHPLQRHILFTMAAASLMRQFREGRDATDCATLLKAAHDRGIPRKEHCDGLVFEMVQALDRLQEVR